MNLFRASLRRPLRKQTISAVPEQPDSRSRITRTAVSGGHSPWEMLRALAGEDVPWDAVHVVQVDERIAPAGDPDRNLTHLHESLVEHAPLRPDRRIRADSTHHRRFTACA